MWRLAWQDVWQRADEEDKRLLLMVGVSLILHATLLWLWKAPTASGSMTISALTVFLPARADSRSSISEVHEPPVSVVSPVTPPLPVETKPAIVAPVLTPTPAVPPKTAPPITQAPAISNVAGSPPPQVRSNRPADGVVVVLRVNSDGEVFHIYWNQLPAITNEQFNRLEAIVRTRRFGSHVSDRTITEIIDVRALLDLPPAHPPAPILTDAVGDPRGGALGIQNQSAPTEK